jgi:hypothetical protein
MPAKYTGPFPDRIDRRTISTSLRGAVFATAALTITLVSPCAAFAALFNCPAGDVACLIAAIESANANPDADTIELAAGDYELTVVDNDTDGPNGLPSITSEITINGVGPATAIRRTAEEFRIFHVAASGTLTLDSLTIADGLLTSGNGAGILNAGGVVHLTGSIIADNEALQSASGGGIFNDSGGTLSLTNSTISGNQSVLGEGGCGGIVNKGVADIMGSAVRQNGGTGIGASNGGIRNTGGTLHVINSTIAKNLANEQNGAGILNEDGGSVTITNTTISENTSPLFIASGGGISNESGSVELRNTILAGNLAGDPSITPISNCFGVLTSNGNNVIGSSKPEDNCTINAVVSDIKDVDDGILDAFSDNGTPGNGHYPLLANSPAIDAGNPANPGSGGNACESKDQLGFPRPTDGDVNGTPLCDIGAIELIPPSSLINDELSGTPDPSSFAFDPMPVPGGPAGTFSFTAEFCNVGVKELTGLKSVTNTLTGGNALLNRDVSTPPGVGSERTFPAAQGLDDFVLSGGECVDVLYLIGLTAKTPFGFLVDVVGVAP